jgi:hypothetical protein
MAQVARVVNGLGEAAPPDRGALPIFASGLFGMLPNAVACDPEIDECALVMLGARVTSGGRWLMTRTWALGLVRRGLAERPYWRGLSRLTGKGLVNRLKVANGRQGHGRVVDDLVRLPADKGERYRHVERRWFDGMLSVKAVAALIFMRAQADGEALPWQIRERFGWSFGTIKAVGEELQKAGLIERLGGAQNPSYRACNSQNPQSKKAQSTKARCKNRQPLRTDQPVRTDQSSRTDQLLRKGRARFSMPGGRRTDGAPGESSDALQGTVCAEGIEGLPRGSCGEGEPLDHTAEVMAAVSEECQSRREAALCESAEAIGRGDREPWTPETLRRVSGMGVDLLDLIERYRERTAGRKIDDANAYLVAMAADAVAKRAGTTREFVSAIAADRAAMASAAAGARERASAASREALARRLGGGDMARGYALLAAIPDSPHRQSGQARRASATLEGAGRAPKEGFIGLGARLPAGLGVGAGMATG